MYEEAIESDAHGGSAWIECVVMYVIEDAELMLFEKLGICDESVWRKLYFVALQDDVRPVLVQASQLENVFHLLCYGIEMAFLEGCKISQK